MGSVTWKELLIFPPSRGGKGGGRSHNTNMPSSPLLFSKLTENLLNFAHCLNIHPYKDVITDRHGWV